MDFGSGIWRDRDGTFEVHLSTDEREMLRSLPANVRQALEELDPRQPEDDPVTARLFPGAYLDDPEQDAEYRRLMHEDLAAGRMAALDTFEAGIDADRLSEADVLAWLRALNDTRLLLGTRLGMTEDDARHGDPADPDAAALALYGYLSWLVDELVEALSE